MSFRILLILLYLGLSCDVKAAAKLFDEDSAPRVHQHIRPETNFYQSAVAGCVAGMADVVVNHPLWAIKIMMQNGEKLNFHPRSLYRGLVSNTLTMIPLTTARVAISSTLQRRAHSADEEDSPLKIVTTSFIGGAIPSLFAGPTELLRNLEHKYSWAFWNTYNTYVAKKGYLALFRGTPGVALRDGIYTTSFAALAPLGKNYLETNYNMGVLQSSILAAMSSGLFAAVASHPFDTIKVIQQARSLEEDLSMVGTIKACHKEMNNSWLSTVKRIYRGMIPRGIRTISGVVVISSVTSLINGMFHDYNSKALV